MLLSLVAMYLSSRLRFARPGASAPRLHAHPRSRSARWRRDLHRSVSVGVDDGLGEGTGGFLGQVVPDAAFDQPVLVPAGELAGVGAGVGVRGAVGVALEGDGRDGDGRGGGEAPLQVVIFRLALGPAESPAVIDASEPAA